MTRLKPTCCLDSTILDYVDGLLLSTTRKNCWRGKMSSMLVTSPTRLQILVIGNEPGNFESFTSYNRRKYGSGAAAVIDDSTTNEELQRFIKLYRFPSFLFAVIH
ncbi:hypothetical protein BDP27DRAFT_1371675 [Rhodocollybia butyracea]|uniref:Uncharacterized protein n=1 Tax=Rhodocollybia butyracea TaxID=206335 RepID=A0A9P5P5I6_9AGAR|nr:hypothetical protein BDP27DRAFT_1371675 [Rhodocollybia butyracea]